MRKRVISLLLAALLLCGCGSKQAKWQEQYDLGVRYLSDGDYEEAIIAFSAAIEIDPNNPDAYVLRGDAYVMAAGAEPDNAEEYLRKAKKDYKKAARLDDSLEEEMEEKLEELEELADGLTEPSDPSANLQIPEDAWVWENHSYAVVEYAGTWEEAVEYCASLGGYPAVITSQEENDALYAYMLELGHQSAYIGLTDSAEEGIWVWITGEESDYRNWHSGEPNGENDNEDYAMFYYKYADGTWNDGDFGGSTVNGGISLLCEWDAASETASGDKNLDWQKKPENSYSFDTFLSEKGYMSQWEDTYGPPESYALLDINGDGTEELIILSGTTNGFYGYQIYFFDPASGEILLAVLDSGNPGTLYGGMSYCPEHKALVFNCVRNMASDGFKEYHAFDGSGFICIGSIGWTNFDEYAIYLYGESTALTYEEWAAITSGYQTVEFTELP